MVERCVRNAEVRGSNPLISTFTHMLAQANPVTITDVVGWWGGILATIVAIWEWYKWKTSGPKFLITAQANMQYAVGGQLEDQKYIMVTVTNVGDARSTLTNLLIIHYKSKADMKRKTPEDRMIPRQILEGKLPHPLDPGDEWMCLLIQHDELDKMIKDGFVAVIVSERGRRHETPVEIFQMPPGQG